MPPLALLLAQAAPLADPAPGLSPTGWTVMILSVVSVLCLLFFCLYRVMTLPPVDK